MSARRIAPVLAALLALPLTGCEREQRRFDPPPSPSRLGGASPTSALHAGPNASQPTDSAALGAEPPGYPVERNAYAVSQGKRLYRWYNCNGCHAGGGGGMGPPLMDEHWRYGHEPQQIVATILQGRPNGMPSFAGRMPDDHAWQLAAYVRSMSGQLRTDVAPSRGDTLSAGPPEQRRVCSGLRADALT